jgi:hypothetical protein
MSYKFRSFYLFIKAKIATLFVQNRLDADSVNSPFFIVVTPGSLHLVKLCLQLVPEDQDIVLVLNGVMRWERQWIKRHLRAKELITFPLVLNHDQVIDYLLTWMDKPFGLLDYDCFVFAKDCFYKIKNISENTSFAAYYGALNEELGVVFPETFFVFINTPVLYQLQKKYGVDSKIIRWDDLPITAQKKLTEVGINREQLPESRKDYFNTLRVLMALSLAENYQFAFPPEGFINYMEDQPDDIFHVGSTFGVPYYGAKTTSLYRARGAYFWYRALELEDNLEIREKYYKKYGYWSTDELLKQFPISQKALNDFVTTVNKIIEQATVITGDVK